MILMLEDDQDRVDRFKYALDLAKLDFRLKIWRNVNSMIDDIPHYINKTEIISLDHDLDPVGDEEPGTGYDVVKFLCTLLPVCPVIVHTSNSTRADWMQGELDLNGWKYRRVPAIGDDWIETHWITVVKKIVHNKKKQV